MKLITFKLSLLFFLTICYILFPPFRGIKGGFAQSIHVGFLFKPGLSIGTEYTLPAEINDTAKFQISKYRAQLVLPIRTKMGISFKKLDAKASQLFLTFNTSLRRPDIGLFDEKQSIYTIALGLTGLSASIRSGLWVYSANLYFSESKGTISSPTPNFLGYVARIRLNNLRFIYFYGAGLVYNQGRVLPVPLLGFTYKLNKDWRVTMIFPVQAKLTCKFSKKVSINLISTLSGFNAVFRESSYFGEDFLAINYSHLKNNVSFNYKFKSNFKVIAEAGITTFRRLSFLDAKEVKEAYSIRTAPYAGVSLYYNFGNSLFESKIEGVD
ncbi:MAG: hypothetical protein FVQ77_11890 [Cytophagales bacterium]|nr:hypothetical protein [Cytophagales bacterium]